MIRQPEINFTELLAQWPETAAQTIVNRRTDISILTVLYERLSHDDDFAAESNSIKNQKSLLQDYALKNDFPNIIHLTDDGVSGTRFDRPGFVKAMELVESGCVGAFLVKDLSRFGRDHLRVGLYTERLRECGVRFIAVQDNVDSANGEDEFSPFRNIIKSMR
jgi:DNA invertase Pin-like site-specific DNA recombinase